MAIHACIRLLDCRGMVSFTIEPGREIKHIPRAVGNAVAALLASFLDDVDYAAGNLDFIGIQRRSPVFHMCLPLPGEHGKPASASSPGAVLRLQQRAQKRLGSQREHILKHPPSGKAARHGFAAWGARGGTFRGFSIPRFPSSPKGGKPLLSLSNSFPKLSNSSALPLRQGRGDSPLWSVGVPYSRGPRRMIPSISRRRLAQKTPFYVLMEASQAISMLALAETERTRHLNILVPG